MQQRSLICPKKFLIMLACIALLLMPAESSIEIKFAEKETPYTYKTDENVSINWYWDYYPRQLESYTLSVIEKNNKASNWSDTVQLDDLSPGNHSPINRSIDLGRKPEGTYLAVFNSRPNDDFPPINYYDIFLVAQSTGFVQIADFYDSNGNSKLDSGEGFNGTEFQIIGPNGLINPITTGYDGTTNFEVPIGQYEITKTPRDCYRSLNGLSQIVNVLKDQTTQVEFRDEPDTDYAIFGYDNSNHKGLSGFIFIVTGPYGTQTLISGPDGFAKPSSIVLPGNYTVIATPPVGKELTTSSTTNFNPCNQKRLEFGAKPPLEIADILPTNGSILGHTDVVFTWRTSEESTSELYIKKRNESNYTLLRGQDGLDLHSVNATNLTRNIWYDFYVKSEAGNIFHWSSVKPINCLGISPD
jgi:hypothetical protein